MHEATSFDHKASSPILPSGSYPRASFQWPLACPSRRYFSVDTVHPFKEESQPLCPLPSIQVTLMLLGLLGLSPEMSPQNQGSFRITFVASVGSAMC